MRGLLKAAAAAAACFATKVLADVDPIVIKGQHFFYKTNGTEFFIRGVAYQQSFSGNGTSTSSNQFKDPLTDVSGCTRDIPNLVQLRTNVVRVYAIDAQGDHDQCMQMLQNAGIYVIADLSEPGTSIVRDSPEWNDDLYNRYASVIDTLSKYNNVIGFFAGNEVSNNDTNTDASAFVKAAVRDMKAYIKQKNYRPMGVGYATSDNSDIRTDLANYFDCGPRDEAIDFWGYNIYSWCGDSSFTESGYDQRVKEFSTYNVPAFFAEYGCNVPSPRKFSEVQALYGDQMTGVFSGGIVYMYFQEDNNYGLVSVDGDTASKLPDFTALSSQLAKISPKTTDMSAYNPTNTAAQSCPSVGSQWAAASALPPTPNQELCGCMANALTCTVDKSVQDKDIGDLFGTVCGLSDEACAGIQANATMGKYGAYGMCNARQQAGWALNYYYSAQGAASSACDFSGSATLQKAVAPTGNCLSLVKQAGGSGTGTVTSAPTGTAPAGSNGSGSGGSGSGSSGSASSSQGSVGHISAPSLNMGFQLGAYILVAVVSGAAMVLL
ncbi:MAG: hypothetical protein Q9227_007902 [Pyrenula ochraceoflavens]